MNKEFIKIKEQLPPMLSGDGLTTALTNLPKYDKSIRRADTSERMLALEDIYSIYIPSDMSREIYCKLYLAMIQSLKRKTSREAVGQYYDNYKMIKGFNGTGIIGGSDSLSIIGRSGLGKSSAIGRAVRVATGNRILEVDNPYMTIIPCLIVQCPHDCSVKGLLFDILNNVDRIIGSDYREKAVKSRTTTTDILIASVSNVLLNHVGVLIVDEIQNVIRHRGGLQLVTMLTQLINNSGISIIFVGTPEVQPFFETTEYLARRTIGLHYDKAVDGNFFRDFCKKIYAYQYISESIPLSEGLINWFYEHSDGLPAVVVSLIHDAQELAIIRGRDRLDREMLETAYRERLDVLSTYIRQDVIVHPLPKRKKTGFLDKDNQKGTVAADECCLTRIIASAKENGADIVSTFCQHVPVMEVKIC